MVQFIHHVPGRLRVKTAAIKRRGLLAEQAIAHLGALEGVTAAAANPVTGSIVVNYDATRTNASKVLDSLKQGGYVHDDAAGAPTRHVRAAGIAERVGDTIMHKLIETVVERSAVALIGALI